MNNIQNINKINLNTKLPDTRQDRPTCQYGTLIYLKNDIVAYGYDKTQNSLVSSPNHPSIAII